MTRQAPAPAALGSLDSFLELAASEPSGRTLVEKLLQAVVAASGGRGGAVYVAEEAGHVRELVAGELDFPHRLPAKHDYKVLKLGGAELALDAGADPESACELIVALATALRLLSLEKKIKRQRFEVNYRGVELEALYDVGLAIASTLNLEELSEGILLRAVSLLDARRGALYFVDDGGYSLSRTFGGEARARIGFDDPRVGEALDDRRAGSQDLLPGAEHLLAVAIEVDGEPRGLLVVGDKESRRGVGPFPSADRRTLSLFANQAAIALENAHLHRQALEKERLEREAELAAEIQRRLLPATIPVFEGLDLIGWSRPARQVGGDYYDLLRLDNQKLGAVVADVSGKGMPAALMVSTLYSALRLLVDRAALGPELAIRLNQHIFESSAPNKFITLLTAEVDPVSGRVDYLNAGHNPGLLVRADGELSELPSGGLPLGLFPDARFESGSIQMASGDLLCFFSDGITEAASPDDEEFGPERLAELLRQCASWPLAEIVDRVEKVTTAFAQGMPQADDQTLVLLRKV